MAFFGWTSLQVGLTFAIMVFGIGIGALGAATLTGAIGPVAMLVAFAALLPLLARKPRPSLAPMTANA